MDPQTIVLGLGNPGQRYRQTRHNLGFRVVDALERRRAAGFTRGDALGRLTWTAEVAYSSGPIILAKPRCFMNRSGRAAAALCRHYGLSPRELLVVYDDADLELGRLRVREAGGHGGHNGVRSVIEVLGTQEFPRIRLGVLGQRREETQLADYVLERFEPAEEPIAEALAALGADAVETVLEQGLMIAMNEYNGRTVTPSE